MKWKQGLCRAPSLEIIPTLGHLENNGLERCNSVLPSLLGKNSSKRIFWADARFAISGAVGHNPFPGLLTSSSSRIVQGCIVRKSVI